MKSHRSWCFGWVVCCLAVVLGGCRGADKVTVVVRPRFEYEQIKRVAIIGFKNSTGDARANGPCDAVATKLDAILVQNNTYQVVTRDKLQAVLAEQNLSASGLVDASTAQKIGKIAVVDVLIAGTVTQFRQEERNETRYRDQYGMVNGQFVKTGSVPYTWTHRQVDISASLQVINTTTGLVIWSDDRSSNGYANGAPPQWSIGQCQEGALNQLANALAKGIVPHVAEVKVPKESIYTCKSFSAGQFMDKTDKFTNRDETVQVVLALNQDFTDTRLLLRIVQKDREQIVTELEHVWTGKYGQFGFPYKMADLMQKGGYGKYEAQYFIGGKEIGVVEFNIREVK